MTTGKGKRNRLTGQQAYILSHHLDHMRATGSLPMQCSAEEAAKKLGQVLGLAITARNLRSAANAVGLELQQVAEAASTNGRGTVVSYLCNQVKSLEARIAALESRITAQERQRAVQESWNSIQKGEVA